MVQATEKVESASDIRDIRVNVGRLFFEERTRRNLTISDVSQELHIRQLYLQAIESGDLDTLPGYVYILGFIRSYATYLDLDAREIFRQLALEPEEPVLQKVPHIIPRHQQQTPSLKVLFASLTLLVTLTLSLYVFNNQPISAPEIKEGTLQGGLTSAPFKIEDVLSSPPLTLPREDKPLQPIVNEASPAPFPQLKILAEKDAWVQILNEKKESVFVRLMHRGESYEVPTKHVQAGDWTLNTGNGGGLKFIINGQPTEVLGAEGKVIRGIPLKIPAEN